MKTIFCDIDGTLCVHHEDIIKQHREELTLLPQTLDVLNEWERSGGIGVHHTNVSKTISELKRLGFK